MRPLHRLSMVVVAVLVFGYFPPASAQDGERISTAQEVKDLMYESFKEYRDSHWSREQREVLHQKLLNEQGSLFASHPTFGERMQAVAELPKAGQSDSRPALALFDNADEIEKELTQFLTDYMAYIQQLQAQAAAAAQQA